MSFRLCGLLLFTIILITAASAAFAEKPDYAINIQMDPIMNLFENNYKEALQQVTPEQRAILEHLDAQATKADEPDIAWEINKRKFHVCTRRDPELRKSYGKILENYKFSQLDTLKENRKAFHTEQQKINFIDPKLLAAHIEFNRQMQRAMMTGIAEVQFQMIAEGKADAECDNLKKELADFTDPYVVTAQYPPPKSFTHRDANGRIMSCTVSIGHDIPQLSSQISTSIVFIKGRQQAVDFEYSTKIFSQDKSFHTIEDTWLEFGTINTGFKGGHSKPGEQIMIGSLPEKYIVPVLYFLKREPVISGAKATGWEKTVAFKTPVLAPDEAANLASCVAALNPALAPALHQAGFQITQDKRHNAAPPSSTNGAEEEMSLYGTKHMMQSGNDGAGICTWNLGPFLSGDAQIIGVLTATGFVRETHALNHSFTFWIFGLREKDHQQTRLTFSDAALITKNPATGAIIDTRKFQTASTAGQRYEIQIPITQLDMFLQAIRANGFTFKLHEEAAEQPFQKTFPAPNDAAYRRYADCLGKVLPDIALTP